MPGKENSRRIIVRGDPRYPALLSVRLAGDAPLQLTVLGNLELLALPKTALFCSARCPGSAILAAYDQAARWRDEGRCVIGGFHSQVEKECLRILLRGYQPIVICPARALNGMRLPSNWRTALADGRLLLLSPFEKSPRRPTIESAQCRNELVAVLADEVFIAYITPGGKMERLSERLKEWKITFTNETR